MMVFLHPAINILFVVLIIALQSSRESYVEFSLSTFIEVSPRQPLKVPFPMFFTNLGISMEVKPVQPRNALEPIVVREFGEVKVTEVNAVHSLNAILPMLVTLYTLPLCFTAAGITTSPVVPLPLVSVAVMVLSS